VLSWIGDLLLTYDDRKAFTAGLVSFLFGHVAFSVGFGVLGIEWVVALGATVVVAVVAAFVWRWLSPHVGDMVAPVAVSMIRSFHRRKASTERRRSAIHGFRSRRIPLWGRGTGI